MQDIQSKSLFAKILATEDINLVIDVDARTASFRYDTRTLTLPKWNVSEFLERLFISHEVAHALFTDPVKRINFIESYDVSMQKFVARALNIVEDARIEKLIIRKYPGLVKDYIMGYIELINVFRFFPNTGKNIYDKINYYFKVNVSGKQPSSCTYNIEEQYFIDKILKIETYDETIEVTRELIDKHKLDIEDIENLIQVVFESEEEPCCDTGEGETPKNKNEIQLSNFKLQKVRYQKYIKFYTSKNDLKIKIDNDVIKFMQIKFRKYKNALKYKNTIKQKTGDIHQHSLYRYRFDEKIFETKIKQPKQTNHAVILLIDGSGSMSDIMKYVAMQAYNIAEFCNLEKINFRCFVFQDRDGVSIESFKGSKNLKLLEFFTKGKNFENEAGIISKLASGGTPLSESLMILFSYIEELKTKFDKISLITITDGGCNNSHLKLETINYKNSYYSPEIDSNGMFSPVTALLKLYRDYYNVKVISFDIGDFTCYTSKNKCYGVDKYFQVPSNFITDKENSRQFLEELVRELS